MVLKTDSRPSFLTAKNKKNVTRPKIAVFYCSNSLEGEIPGESDDFEIRNIRLPCSSMTRELVLLKAFESGADAVLVLACRKEMCRHIDGSIRAKKRVDRVKSILDSIGLDGRRLSLHHVKQGDRETYNSILEETGRVIEELGTIVQ